jgi:hypothetical protein
VQDSYGGQTSGVLKLTVTEMNFDGAEKLDERVLVQSEHPYDPALQPVGSTLAEASFEARPRAPLPEMARFDPLTPANLGVVVEQLRRVAGWWRARQFEPLTAWMAGYFRDYAAAYPLETEDGIRRQFLQTAEYVTGPGSEVRFDPAAVRLEPCAGGRLADALSAAGGAAVRVAAPKGQIYDFWNVVGLVGGQPVLVR